jgi:hypothetical protein
MELFTKENGKIIFVMGMGYKLGWTVLNMKVNG